MTKHIQWDGQLSIGGFDILKKERVAVTSALPKLATSSWPVTRLAWNEIRKQRTQRNKPGVVLCGRMDELRALAQVNPEIRSLLPKTLGWRRYLAWLYRLGVKMPMQNYPSFRRWTGRTHDRRSWDFMLCQILSKAGEQIAKNVGKEGKMVYASSTNPSR